MASLLAPLLTGTLFGTSLTLSSVYLPSIILSQLSLTSTHMLSTFLTASCISAVIIYISNRTYTSLPPRTNTSYGWFGAYDANLVGGLLQGLGMAITGACPGTGIVQVAVGIPGAGWVILGGVAGGLAFVVVAPKLKRSVGVNASAQAVKEKVNPSVKGHTVMQRFKISDEAAVLVYEALLIGAILAIDKFGIGLTGFLGTSKPSIHPVLGGTLIGIAQASSVLLSKKTLGVSSAYSDLASHITAFLKTGSIRSSATSWSNIVFAIGVGLGGILAVDRSSRLTSGFGSLVSGWREYTAGKVGSTVGGEAGVASIPVLLLGGFASIFGARMAGGCTSGHGISGMSTLSVSSFVTVMGMFGGGMVIRGVLDQWG